MTRTKSEKPMRSMTNKKNNVIFMKNIINKPKVNKFLHKKKISDSKNPEMPSEEKLKLYSRGKPTDIKMVKIKVEQAKIAKREEKIQYGLQQSVKSEVLLTEDSGYLIPDKDETSTQFSQKNIKNSVDLLSASKAFDLNLKFGPYRMNYTRNGRNLLLGGQRGHVCAFDWIEKKLLCEINVMEEIFDISWFHQETMFAVAQKKWTYMYDNQGVEIHCVKQMNNIYRLLFLPYHFLLAGLSTKGSLCWLDVSVGKIIQDFQIYRRGNTSTVALHPSNATICLGEPNGVVTFWGPNSNKPVISKWCHKQAICTLAFDPRGQTFATAAIGGKVKLWDARSLKGPIQHYIVRSSPKSLAISHKGVMALGTGNLVEVFNDIPQDGILQKQIYLRHKVSHVINNMEFCPFEDVLGVAHQTGFCSMLVPGCGEANFDALEINPFQTKTQRREAEVKSLLGKIPADLITWNNNELLKINLPSSQEIVEAKKQITNIKAPEIEFTPKKKTRKKAGSLKAPQRKKVVKEDFKRNYVKQIKEITGKTLKNNQKRKSRKSKESLTGSVLDRFKRNQNK